MRFGDLLKEHATQLGDHHEAKTRIAALGRELEALTQNIRTLATDSAASIAAASSIPAPSKEAPPTSARDTVLNIDVLCTVSS